MMKRTTIAAIAVILTVTLAFYATASTEGGGSSDTQFEATISNLIAEQYPEDWQNSIRAHGSTDSSVGAELAKRMEESKSGETIGVIVLLKPQPHISSLASQKSVVGALQDRDMDVEHQYNIINGIAAKIPTESIKDVADLPGVECVYLDREIHLIHPIESEEPAQTDSVGLAEWRQIAEKEPKNECGLGGSMEAA